MFETIYSQPGAVLTLQRALQNEQLAHSYLFEGPSGVGKEKTALILAKALICTASEQRPCAECPACRRFLHGTHPDVKIVRPRAEGSGNVKVDYIREQVIPFARFAPFEARAACIVFADAERCFPAQQAEAANALLKTLEEPKARVHFVLVSANPSALLSTIRSRCQRLRFRRLPEATIDRILMEKGIPEAARALSVALSSGQADRALTLAEDVSAKELLTETLKIHTALGTQDPASLLEVAETLANHPQRQVVLHLLKLLYRDLGARSWTATKTPVLDSLQHIEQSAPSSVTVHTAFRAAQIINRTCAALEQLAQPQLTLEAMAFQIATMPHDAGG